MLLSRYGNNPGPRHIEFLKHLLKYCKYAKLDRLKFPTHDGPTDMKTMTQVLQLKFQCDSDLGGNQDNGHSQTSYIGYLGESVICWCSTDQGSVSTSTAESEIKAVNHTLKAELISNRGIMNAMGWIQQPTIIQEDNQACVYASEAKHMTRNLRHLEDLSHCLHVCRSVVRWELQSIQLCILAMLEEMLEKFNMPRAEIVAVSR